MHQIHSGCIILEKGTVEAMESRLDKFKAQTKKRMELKESKSLIVAAVMHIKKKLNES